MDSRSGAPPSAGRASETLPSSSASVKKRASLWRTAPRALRRDVPARRRPRTACDRGACSLRDAAPAARRRSLDARTRPSLANRPVAAPHRRRPQSSNASARSCGRVRLTRCGAGRVWCSPPPATATAGRPLARWSRRRRWLLGATEGPLGCCAIRHRLVSKRGAPRYRPRRAPRGGPPGRSAGDRTS